MIIQRLMTSQSLCAPVASAEAKSIEYVAEVAKDANELEGGREGERSEVT